ncbi:hypothetical protein FNH22_18020 [Fulvivirga sp. M361]|uniref:YncE family protein n=1 Tax=Fulvivirga sp. M361 TaxID=2594266 RepID=UPI00117AE4A0|nr:DUF5074 domain-containing protein [Fulvivirga sp. M361]TRX55532.1 hypothetical protein FNH22_18020 [Fulvivirga sp. M361]
MMNKLRHFSKIILFTLLWGTFSCNNDEDVSPISLGENGFFIVNEGLFNGGTASLSFFDVDTEQIQNNIFFTVNGQPLGDQAQSMTIIGDKGYIVVQNSNKIEVIDTDNVISLATIDGTKGIASPRYLLAINDEKAYISDWGATGDVGTVKVLDLTTNTVTKTIPTGFGTNRMILVGENVYAANGGGFNNITFEPKKDNRVVVINTSTDEVTQEITVGDNPKSLDIDSEGNIWVAGTGNIVLNDDFSVNLDATTPGFISKISPDNEVLFTVFMSQKNVGPNHLVFNKSKDGLYLDYEKDIYNVGTIGTNTEEDFEMNLFIDREKEFYGFAVNPSNGNFIGTVAPGFSSDGFIIRYTEEGELIGEHTSGIAPNSATFK